MKKIVLLVASVLTALQSYANRSTYGAQDNSLILSPSDGVYNHGSHASHASHCSHYSMSITIKKDSIQEVSQKEKEAIIHALAIKYNCDEKDIDIINLYISKKNEIITQEKGDSVIVRYTLSRRKMPLYQLSQMASC